jgi:hypothetical protein
VAGRGKRGNGADGDPLTWVNRPRAVYVRGGVLYIDSENHKIRTLAIS